MLLLGISSILSEGISHMDVTSGFAVFILLKQLRVDIFMYILATVITTAWATISVLSPSWINRNIPF